ncbi:MAG3720 family protein [Mycoplasmopsis hyopharyngis]|uniref:MAG3720 family protein n=1 Tax=Mycoplasmopsis hyopharyngis TaxID=29558 RepID=UPI003872B47D
MKSSQVVLYLDFDKIEIKVSSMINNEYEIIEKKSYDFSLFNSLEQDKEKVILYFKKIISKYKNLESSLVIADTFLKNIEIKKNVSSFAVKKYVNESILKSCVNDIEELNGKSNYKYSKNQWALFKLFDCEETIKKYQYFPFHKEGNKLEVESYVIELDKNKDFLEIANFFNSKNIYFNNYFLKSQVIVPSYGTIEKTSIFINMEDKIISINKFFNGTIMEHHQIDYNIVQKVKEYTKNKFYDYDESEIKLLINSVLHNWKNNFKGALTKGVRDFIKNSFGEIVYQIVQIISKWKDFDRHEGIIIVKGLENKIITNNLCSLGFNAMNHDPFYSNNILKNDIVSGTLFLTKNYISKLKDNVVTLDSTKLIKTKPKPGLNFLNVFSSFFRKMFKKRRGEQHAK